MAAPRVWNTEWLADNSQRHYPLLSGVTRVDATGAFKLPNSTLLDLSLLVTDASFSRVNNFYLSAVAYYTGGLVFTFSYGSDTLGVATVPLAAHSYADSYPIISATGDGYRGSVTIGDVAELLQQPMGVWSFTADGGRLQPRCVIPSFRDALGIRVKSNGVRRAK